jgi:hypothetical protein
MYILTSDEKKWGIFAILAIILIACCFWLTANRQPSDFDYGAYRESQARENQRAEIMSEIHRQDVEQTARALRGF